MLINVEIIIFVAIGSLFFRYTKPFQGLRNNNYLTGPKSKSNRKL